MSLSVRGHGYATHTWMRIHTHMASTYARPERGTLSDGYPHPPVAFCTISSPEGMQPVDLMTSHKELVF